MIREGVKHSARINGLTDRAENLFYRLLTTVDDLGRYYAEPALIKAACWPLKSIRLSEVALALDSLERAGLIARYAGKDGARLLCLLRFRQRLQFGPRPKFPPPPFDEESGEIRLFEPEPPPAEPKPRKEKKRREEKGEEREAPAPAPPQDFGAWTERLRAEWPGIDILAEYDKACRLKKTPLVDRPWFEASWLPKCSPSTDAAAFAALRAARTPPSSPTEPEPDGWREVLVGTQLGPGGACEVTSWAQIARDKDRLGFVKAELARRRNG
jgi:hypothetical protein